MSTFANTFEEHGEHVHLWEALVSSLSVSLCGVRCVSCGKILDETDIAEYLNALEDAVLEKVNN